MGDQGRCPKCGQIVELEPVVGRRRWPTVAVHQGPDGWNCTGGGHSPWSDAFGGGEDELSWWERPEIVGWWALVLGHGLILLALVWWLWW